MQALICMLFFADAPLIPTNNTIAPCKGNHYCFSVRLPRSKHNCTVMLKDKYSYRYIIGCHQTSPWTLERCAIENVSSGERILKCVVNIDICKDKKLAACHFRVAISGLNYFVNAPDINMDVPSSFMGNG